MMNRNKPTIKEKFGRYIDQDAYWTQAIEWGKDEKTWLDVAKLITFEQLLQTKPWNN